MPMPALGLKSVLVLAGDSASMLALPYGMQTVSQQPRRTVGRQQQPDYIMANA